MPEKDSTFKKKLQDLFKELNGNLKNINSNLDILLRNTRKLHSQFPTEDLQIIMNAKNIKDPLLEETLAKLVNRR